MGKKKKAENRIKEKIERLEKLFADIPDNKRELVRGLLENAAFMEVTLEDLRKTVTSEGAIAHVVNGNGFEVLQEHPAQKSYNAIVNRYSSVIADLARILPESSGINKLKELMSDDSR